MNTIEQDPRLQFCDPNALRLNSSLKSLLRVAHLLHSAESVWLVAPGPAPAREQESPVTVAALQRGHVW